MEPVLFYMVCVHSKVFMLFMLFNTGVVDG